MEEYDLKKDVKIFCVPVTSFPSGVMEAWNKLHAMLQNKNGRNFYGISYENKNGITYKAAVEESFKGEAEKFGCETLVIKKGNYLTEPISDYMKKIETIGPIFQKLLADPRLDKNSFCVEWYKTDTDMLCMVKLMDDTTNKQQ